MRLSGWVAPLLACLCTLFSTAAMAQTPATLWAVTSNGVSGKSISLGPVNNPLFPTTSMRVDAAGNSVLVGTTSPFASGGVLVTLKFDTGGNELWRATYDTAVSRDDDACCLALGPGGNIYVVGTQNVSSGFPSVIMVKYSAAGQELWRSTSVTGTQARGITVDAAGDAYVASIASGGGYVVTRVSSAGAVVWTTTLAGMTGDAPFAIAVDAFGQAHITGRSSNGNDFDYLTVKFNSAGTEIWRARMNSGTGNDDSASAIAIDANGNVYVTGSTGSGFASDFATVKYSAGGSEIWRRTLNSPGGSFDTARAIALDAVGNVYVAGSGQNTTFNDDFITVKYDSSGTEKWRALADSAAGIHDEGFALTVDAAQSVYVTGFGSNHLGGPSRGMTVKYNVSGGEVWRLALADIGSSFDSGKAVALDVAGNVYVGGSATRTGQAFSSMTLVKYSQSGAVVPNAPAITSATVSSGSVQIQFQPPVSNGGSAIIQYVATCGALPPVSGLTSPLTVSGLVLGLVYPCVVSAVNGVGTGAPSAVSPVQWTTAPNAPTSLQLVGGNGLIRVGFSPPAFTGGLAILSYTTTCNPGAITVTGPATSLIFSGLSNGQSYSCSVVATNAAGDSAASPTAVVTPGGFGLTGVKSRKTHGVVGDFDLAIDPVGKLDGTLTVEPRALGSGHKVVIQFNGPLLTGGTASVTDASGQPVGSLLQEVQGSEVMITILGVPENQRARIQLSGVNGMLTVSVDVAFHFGNLRSVLNALGENFRTDSAVLAATAAADISAIKSLLGAQNGQPVSALNFIFDVNIDGTIDGLDLAAIKARSGTKLR